MKKDLFLHFLYLIAFFSLIVVFKGWFDVQIIILFILGGLAGTLLPYVDYLIYAFAIKPQVPLTSTILTKKNIITNLNQYYNDKSIAADLIFHSALFQALLTTFLFYVVTSSGSIFARGIVLAFALHLLLDQMLQWRESRSVDTWFSKLPIELNSVQKKTFVLVCAALLPLFGLFF